MPSEDYILTVRYILEKNKIPPWQWDEEYPDDMYGRYFPEDINALVQIDMSIDKYIRKQRGEESK